MDQLEQTPPKRIREELNSPIDGLNANVVYDILTFLEVRDVLKVMRVLKSFKITAEQPLLWREKTLRRLP